jgi:hypothetical protein
MVLERIIFYGSERMVPDNISEGGCWNVHLGRVFPMGESEKVVLIDYHSLDFGKVDEQGKFVSDEGFFKGRV